MKKINVCIVTNNKIIKHGIESLLQNETWLNIVFTSGDPEKLIEFLSNNVPEILFLSVDKPASEEKKIVDQIADTFPGLQIIVASKYINKEYVGYFVDRSIMGIMAQGFDIENIKTAIIALSHQKNYYDESVSTLLSQRLKLMSNQKPAKQQVLDRFDEEILKLYCAEKTDKEIAGIVNLSKRAVEDHKKKIKIVTGSKSLAGMVLYACVNRIIDIN